MTNLVEFPGLGLSLKISNVAFTIFGIDIYWYGLLIGIGMILAVALALKIAWRFGIDADRMIDVIAVGFVCSIVGARLYYVVFIGTHYDNLWDIINLRDGGLAIYGSIIGAFIGAVIGCKWRKMPLLPLLDLAGMCFLIGQAIGRWGNFFNQEAFGSNTFGRFGMISQTTTNYLLNAAPRLAAEGIFVDPYAPVHPTFLYESVWCAIGFVLLFLYYKHRRFNGEMLLFYVFWYGAGRFFIEGLRTDSLMLGSVRVSQALALLSSVAALVAWAVLRRRFRGKPLVVPEIPPHTAKVKVQTDAGEQTVTISWPAGERAPDKEQRVQLAKQILKAEKPQVENEDDSQAEASAPEKEKPAKAEKAEQKKEAEKPVKDAGHRKDKTAKAESADAPGQADSEDAQDDE